MTERLLLVPVLEVLINAYPFEIVGFHADNGSEYMGLVILLYKLLSQTGAGGSEKGSRRAVPVR